MLDKVLNVVLFAGFLAVCLGVVVLLAVAGWGLLLMPAHIPLPVRLATCALAWGVDVVFLAAAVSWLREW